MSSIRHIKGRYNLRRFVAGLVAFFVLIQLTPPPLYAAELAVTAIESTGVSVAVSAKESDAVLIDSQKTGTATVRMAATTATAMTASASTGGRASSLPSQTANTSQLPKTDLSTGALVFDYPINLPAGKGKSSPSLALSYNSQNTEQDSIVGYGWSIAVPVINRTNKTGAPDMYQDDSSFTSSLSGELVRTTGRGAGDFRARVDQGDDLRYRFIKKNDESQGKTDDASYWVVTDKQGTAYTFGASPDAVVSNAPITPVRVASWYLTEIKDANGNTVVYRYVRDGARVYPLSISFGSITTAVATHTVNIGLEDRPDTIIQYRAGFEVKTKKRIKTLSVVTPSGSTVYSLEYVRGDNGVRSLLSAITQTATGESGAVITSPPTRFEYSKNDHAKGLADAVYIQGKPLFFGPGSYLVDLNGDGFQDFVAGVQPYYSGPGTGTPAPIDVAYLNDGKGNYIPAPEFKIGVQMSFWLPGTYPPMERLVISGMKMLDMNGDGRADMFTGSSVKYNTGAGWGPHIAVDASGSTAPLGYSGCGGCVVPTLGDFNGDGLVDVMGVRAQYQYPPSYIVFRNTGTGFVLEDDWRLPMNFSEQGGEIVTAVEDLNGDGLADIVQSFDLSWSSNNLQYQSISKRKVFLNTGSKSWVEAPEYEPQFIQETRNAYTGHNTQARCNFIDVNADGLVDVSPYLSAGLDMSYLGKTGSLSKPVFVPNYFSNSGPTYGHTTCFQPVIAPTYQNISLSSYLTGETVIDFDNDGIVDYVSAGMDGRDYGITTTYWTKNTRTKPDLLKVVTHPEGSFIEVDYQPTGQQKTASGAVAHPGMPYSQFVVSEVRTYDGINSPNIERYRYEGGVMYYDPKKVTDRRFAGFASVEMTRGIDGVRTVTRYHQGNGNDTASGEFGDAFAHIGKAYSTVMYDASGQMVTREQTRYAVTSYDGVGVVTYRSVPAEVMSEQFNGGVAVPTGKRLWYDAVGNMSKLEDHGLVTPGLDGQASLFQDIGSDLVVTNTAYAVPGADSSIPHSVSAYPTSVIMANSAGTKLSETRYTYDGLVFGQVNKGNNTKEEKRSTATSFISRDITYNTAGLVLTESDFNGNVTSLTYDVYGLYPATVTNALKQVTKFTYNYQCGKPNKTTEIGGTIKQVVFDGMCRPLTVKQSSPTSATALNVVADYIYERQPLGWRTVQKEYLTTTLIKKTVSYTDGLGRVVQTRSSAPSANADDFVVTDTKYDVLGRVVAQSLPYGFMTGEAMYGPREDQTLYTKTTYDALSRPLQITNSLGNTTYQYAGLLTTVTDANGAQRVLTKDVGGNLTRVAERLGATPTATSIKVLTTTYGYDLMGRLIKITDAQGSVRNFKYDLLGRRATSEDLHLSTDKTFGIVTSVYDGQGNILKTTNPRGGVVQYSYDALHRPTSLTATDELGVLESTTTYRYDTCTKGLGKLCVIERPDYSLAYTYDVLGRPIAEQMTFVAAPPGYGVSTSTPPVVIAPWTPQVFTTKYAYNLRGDTTVRTEPNDTKLRYTYNQSGATAKIEQMLPGKTAYTAIASYAYGPHGQVLTANFANKTTTTNTYDAAKQYRLTNRRTVTTAVLTENTLATGATLQDLTYEYDLVGNITKIVDASQTKSQKTATYTYDSLYRLTKATVVGATPIDTYTEAFTYDQVGNILTKVASGVATKYLYKDPENTNLYVSPQAVLQIGDDKYTYDRSGNVLSDAKRAYTWNALDQLSSTTADAGKTVTAYRYDISGQRLMQSDVVDGASAAYTLYPSKAYNIDSTGKSTIAVSGPMGMVATIETPVGQTGKVLTIMTDHLGSAQVVTGSDGKPVEVHSYLSFGDIQLNDKVGTFDSQRKYIGQHYDAQTGLDYMNARYYNAKTGRFISQDPAFWAPTADELKAQMINPQLFNEYSYAGSNPISGSDPSGRFVNVTKYLPEKAQERIGGFANNLYNNSPVARYVMDHPYQAGVVAGVVAGIGAAVGVVAGGGAITCGAVCGGGGAAIISASAPIVVQKDKVQIIGNSSVKLLNGPIKVVPQGVSHINRRHVPGGIEVTIDKSVFNAGEDIVGLVKSGTQQVARMQEHGNFIRTFDVGRNIGLTRTTREQTSRMSIITGPEGNLITSFPVK